MKLALRKIAAIQQQFRVMLSAGLAFVGLNACAQTDEPIAHHRDTRGELAALSGDANETDSGMEEALCGNGMIDRTEQCDPTTPGWSELCDVNCRRKVYQPCEDSASCGGSNALCAAYVAQPGTQFCAPSCQTDSACPGVPGFSAACNFAWCAMLCNDFGQCPNGMACIRNMIFLDFQGTERGTRNVCAPVASTPIDPSRE